MNDATTKPNPADFSVNEKADEYEAVFHIEGEIRISITADSLDAAKAKARAELQSILNEDNCPPDIDEVTDGRVNYVRKSSPMYRVIREGGKMQVSHLEPGDIPRQPDERGF